MAPPKALSEAEVASCIDIRMMPESNPDSLVVIVSEA